MISKYSTKLFTVFPECQGFTLVELMLAMAISGFITIAVYSVYTAQSRAYLAQEQVTEMQQNIRAGLDIMLVRELRMAGYDPDNSGAAGITAANPASITFTIVADNDGVDNDNADGDCDSTTGVDETGELKTVKYDLYDAYSDGDLDLGRQVGTCASKTAVAENIENIEFYYILADGTKTTSPSTVQLSQIRAIQISLLARAGHPDRKFTNTMNYTTASGAVWGPYNDNFRRRLLKTTVFCRNIGL